MVFMEDTVSYRFMGSGLKFLPKVSLTLSTCLSCFDVLFHWNLVVKYLSAHSDELSMFRPAILIHLSVKLAEMIDIIHNPFPSKWSIDNLLLQFVPVLIGIVQFLPFGDHKLISFIFIYYYELITGPLNSPHLNH